ncbi:MAG: DUF421 domain-containing protein [Clostridia bacterium]|nr:DUF421 domain-containing protein [Clostridia bacterium]
MTTILIRTLLIYIFLIATVRLMGKRQIGELEVTDLVTTFLLSEIAALPVTNQDIPISYALLPMIVLLSLEVFSSYILVRVPKLKSLLSASPTVLINNGVLDQRALMETRVSVDELIAEIRQQQLTDISQVAYAILEKNGKLTVLPKARYAQPNAEELGLQPKSEPLMHIVYSGGCFSDKGLGLINKDRKWLESQFARRGIDKKRLFFATANQKGKLYWLYKT